MQNFIEIIICTCYLRVKSNLIWNDFLTDIQTVHSTQYKHHYENSIEIQNSKRAIIRSDICYSSKYNFEFELSNVKFCIILIHIHSYTKTHFIVFWIMWNANIRYYSNSISENFILVFSGYQIFDGLSL